VGLLKILDTTAQRVSERMTVGIRTEIGPFRGPRRRKLHRSIREAIDLAVDAYLSAAAGDRSCLARAGEHFYGLGRASAASGVGSEPVIDAIRMSRDLFWEEVRPVVVREEVTGTVVADLGSGVASYQSYLEAQVKRGFAAERRGTADPQCALLAALLRPHPTGDITAKAAEAGRRLDEQAVVLTVQRNGRSPAGLVLPARALMRIDGDRTVVVTEPGDVAAVRHALLRLGPEVLVAESWPIELRQSWHGYRWTRSALALARAGRVRPERRVVACERHRITLLIEADLPLVESLADDVLAPLVGQGRQQRWVLAETLLLWLETDEGASALAERLGTHPQTIRHRIRRLRTMFGDCLTGPDERMTLIVVLNAMLPRWRAEQRRR
jgi:hypothetical protein